MKLNDLVNLIVDNPVKKLVTDGELEQRIMLCCESIWGKESLLQIGEFMKELCENERTAQADRKLENDFKIWEAEDIKPGRRYSKSATGEVWLIGYRADADDYKACYVSILENDGMVTSPYTKEELARILNENGYVPVDFL
jgi:hypothetical protein